MQSGRCLLEISPARNHCVKKLDGTFGIPYAEVMSPQPRIVIDPAVCPGKPVVAGKRLPVTILVGSLAGGMSHENVCLEYGVTVEDIRAALRYVAELAGQESFHPLPRRPGGLA
jgi:uncharacterized protein (DUF433 family)